MGANMLTATIATPASRTEPLDFEAGRKALAEITDPATFSFDDFWALAENTLDDLDPDIDPIDENGHPVLELAHRVCGMIIDALEKAFASGEEPGAEIDYRDIAGYRIYIAGGLSWGDAPTDAAQAIWDAADLPESVRTAIGFVLDTSNPPAKSLGSSDVITDSDVVDAIALLLGTNPEWSSPSEFLDDIANLIGRVRQHPGDQDPQEYVEQHLIARGYDPLEDRLMVDYVSDDGRPDDDEDEDEE